MLHGKGLFRHEQVLCHLNGFFFLSINRWNVSSQLKLKSEPFFCCVIRIANFTLGKSFFIMHRFNMYFKDSVWFFISLLSFMYCMKMFLCKLYIVNLCSFRWESDDQLFWDEPCEEQEWFFIKIWIRGNTGATQNRIWTYFF